MKITCRFDNSNTHKIMEGMSEEEMKRFWLDVENVDWEDYVTNMLELHFACIQLLDRNRMLNHMKKLCQTFL